MPKKPPKAAQKPVEAPNLLEMGQAERLEALKRRTPEERDALERSILAILAQEDSVDGFCAYYELVHGNELPEDAKDWIEAMYEAHEEGVGSLTWAYRGSWKSTTISVTFTSFRIGQEPEKTNLVICANDDSADKLTAQIAALIEHSDEWKLVFPNVMPDKDRGWGAEGYFVKDIQMSYERWVKKTAHRIDPSLLGAGINSSRLIGKHPTGMLLMDDIHDERNSISAKECAAVVKIVSDTILPMVVKEKDKLVTWEVVVGTPWIEDDAYHYLKKTGQFNFVSTPAMVAAFEGEDGAVYLDGKNRDGLVFTDITGWWKLARPDQFGPSTIVEKRALSGLRGFARMYLLDLAAAKKDGLTYYLYPHEQIDMQNWPMYGGADLANVMEKGLRDQPGRDMFSHAWGAKTPMNKLVIVGGVLEQCTQAQAEAHLKKPQQLFGRRWNYTVMEGDGIGESIYTAILMRNQDLRLAMMKTKGKAKRWRQEQEMGPWFERASVMISDADSPFLNALRKAFDDFPDGNNDIRDAVYWLCRGVPEVMVVPKDGSEMPTPPRSDKEQKDDKYRNPIYSLARM